MLNGRATLATALVLTLALPACSSSRAAGRRPSTSSASRSAPTAQGVADYGSTSRMPPELSPTTRAARITLAELRSFVLRGTAIRPAGYRRSADRADTRLTRNRFGDLTFETPSRNISCDLQKGPTADTSCWVTTQTHPRARPHACTLEWVPGLVALSDGSVQLGSCRGDPPFARYATVLPYGDTLVDASNHTACRSDPRYVACVSLRRGGGFLANRAGITAVIR